MSRAGLAAVRRRYADVLTARLGSGAAPVRDAFARVPREKFLGPPPWRLLSAFPHDTDDPAQLYADLLVVLAADKRINNGSPALHAHMLHRLAVVPGDHVLHVGAGGGYYTAILAELAGPAGRVTAVEFDPALAAAAAAHLRGRPQVRVVQGDGADFPPEEVQRIYVNFALARPAEAWLDRLAAGGRLLFPLGVPDPAAQGGDAARSTGRAAILEVTRTPAGFAAAFDVPVAFIFAEGRTAGDPALRAAVWEAFGRGGQERVRSLHRRPLPPARAWLSSPGFSLGFDPPGG